MVKFVIFLSCALCFITIKGGEIEQKDDDFHTMTSNSRSKRLSLNPLDWLSKLSPKDWLSKFGNGYDFKAIYPGTKWCGDGKTAKNYDDLGQKKETDLCCRAHDNCMGIGAGKTKFGIKNDGPFSMLPCDCDNTFYSCLKKGSTIDSDIIGVTYFDLINNVCFYQAYQQKCTTKTILFVFKKTVCEDDKSKPMVTKTKRLNRKYLL